MSLYDAGGLSSVALVFPLAWCPQRQWQQAQDADRIDAQDDRRPTFPMREPLLTGPAGAQGTGPAPLWPLLS